MRVAIVLVAAVCAAPVSAQKPVDHVALGVTAQQGLKPEEALQHYQAALAGDSLSYEANWRAAAAAIEIAQKPSSATTIMPAASPADSTDTGEESAAEPQRSLADSMYALAETYARRAISADEKRAEGHFAVAFVLGSRSLVSDPLTRLGMAREIQEEASNAIALDPKHDGAYHILGQWNAAIMRLSEFERGYAENELGDPARNATWDLALRNLEKAVELAPTVIYHRLDLAEAYADAGRPADAKTQVAKIDSLPVGYAKDSDYKLAAKELQRRIENATQP